MTELAFDPSRARRYRPRDDEMKVAVLVVPAGDEPFVLRAPFGEQRMHGPFYVIVDDDGTGSYGAAQSEFERSHRQVAPGQWVKTATVLAYRTDDAGSVRTRLGGHTESVAAAAAGDWLVQQAGGEVQTMDDRAFARRYVEDEPT